MSRSSAAKKARRKKRLVIRNDSWLPGDVHANIKGVARIADEIIPRGWVFDDEFSTGETLTWYYTPSGIDVSEDLDDAVEPVTRIWLTSPDEPHVILVGSDEDADDIALTVEELFGRLEAIEEYRL
ncbi:MAG: hypothetical protein ACRDUX_06095, partial [Mycobacterium sp.]